MGPKYPLEAPRVHFLDKIDHPRVGADGKICLGILQDEWSPAYHLSGVLVSIRALMSSSLVRDMDEVTSSTGSQNLGLSAATVLSTEGAGPARYDMAASLAASSLGFPASALVPTVLKVRPVSPELVPVRGRGDSGKNLVPERT